MQARKIFFQCLLILAVACCVRSFGQTITGNINGTVTDASGAVVPGARITAINVATGVQISAVTNSAGIYNIRFLQIGQYKITVEASNFQGTSVGPFALEVDQTAKVDAQLKVGSSATTVKVSSALAPILDTENGTVSTTITENAIENLPVNGRNVTELTEFMPGVSVGDQNQWNGATGSPNNSGERDQGFATTPNVNGNRASNNNYLLDGIEINDTGADPNGSGVPGYNPSPDALAQVTIISGNPGAEYGNANGGEVLSVMKSGTNVFHGSAFFYLQNWNMDANTFGNKRNGVPISHYTQRIFGGTFGGPVIKDKLFFFADYEAYRKPSSSLGTYAVAPAAWRTGDFSSLLADGTQLYDSQNNFQPFLNNQNVPINNPVAKYLFANPSIYPEPNHTSSNADGTGPNYFGPNVASTQRNDQGDAKIDWQINQKDRVFGRVSIGHASDGNLNSVIPASFPGADDYPFKSVVLNYTRAISNNIVNEARAGASRIIYDAFNLDLSGKFGKNGNSLVGVPGLVQTQPGFTAQGFTTNYQTTIGVEPVGTSAPGAQAIDNIYEYGDNLSWQLGHHSLKMGLQFLRYQNNNTPGGTLGQFNYNGAFTGDPDPNSIKPNGEASGYDFADFVLDYSSAASVEGPAVGTGLRQWRNAFFVQDDYSITPKLTLNLGLRYEYYQPAYEVNNKLANVDLRTGTIILAGVNGDSRALYDSSFSGFDPRLGFAYQVNNRFVIRGGFGTTTFMDTNALINHTGNPPFQTSFSATAITPSKTTTGTPTSGAPLKVVNGFPDTTKVVTSYTAWSPNLRPQIVQSYSLTTEYQINNNSSVTAAYVGETGRHLYNRLAGNQWTQSGLPKSAPFYTLVGATGSITVGESESGMNFNAGELVYRHRESYGLEFNFNYTYSKSLTDSPGQFAVNDISGLNTIPQNSYDLHAEYGPTGSDLRHMVSSTWVYALPFGRGKRFGGGVNRLTDEALGGWTVSGDAVLYSGFPVTFTSNNVAGVNSGAARANHYRKMKIVHGTTHDWWGTDPSAVPCTGADNGICAYGVELPGTFGTAGVGTERSAGFRGIDAAASKDFHVTEKQQLEFRADAFNVGNISSYNNPGQSPSNPGGWGLVQSTRSQQRQIQLSLHYVF